MTKYKAVALKPEIYKELQKFIFELQKTQEKRFSASDAIALLLAEKMGVK